MSYTAIQRSTKKPLLDCLLVCSGTLYKIKFFLRHSLSDNLSAMLSAVTEESEVAEWVVGESKAIWTSLVLS